MASRQNVPVRPRLQTDGLSSPQRPRADAQSPVARTASSLASSPIAARSPTARTGKSGSVRVAPSAAPPRAQSTAPESTPSIPFKKGTEQRSYYDKLIDLVRNRDPKDKPRLLVYTDIDQDYDDLLAIIFLSEMHRMGVVELAGVIANHAPVPERAYFLRTVLDLLGLSKVPVGKGTDGVPDKAKHSAPFFYSLRNNTFIARAKALEAAGKIGLEVGRDLAERLAGEQGKQPLTVLLLSSLKDIGELFAKHQKNPSFLQSNFRKFVSQGGYVVDNNNSELRIDPMKGVANNTFHFAMAKVFTDGLAKFRLSSDAWTKHAATAASMKGTFMKDLFQYGPIGQHLGWVWQRQEFKFFWDPFNIPYMPHLTVEWYLKTRLGLRTDSDMYKDLLGRAKNGNLTFAKVAPLNRTVAYDCCAAVGAVGDDFLQAFDILPSAKSKEFKQKYWYNEPELANHSHRIFGKAEGDLGGINATRLAKVMEVFLQGALLSTFENADEMLNQKSVNHSEVTTIFDNLDLWERNILPPLKVYMKHEANIRKLEAMMEGGTRDKELHQALQNEKAARRQAECVVVDALRRNGLPAKVPSEHEIPYEAMFKKATGTLSAPARR
ncbi:hypothetical protein VTK26DRAFT_709 [Humicola hyalothermophila]